MKDLPLGTEATVSFTEDGQCSWEVGDLKEMRVKVKDLQVPYYSLHNHASNGILSPEDIFQLAKHDNMKGIGAVGHDGALHTCERCSDTRRRTSTAGWTACLKNILYIRAKMQIKLKQH